MAEKGLVKYPNEHNARMGDSGEHTGIFLHFSRIPTLSGIFDGDQNYAKLIATVRERIRRLA